MWRDDDELFRLMREKLFTAVVGDVLDAAGKLRQFLPREIRPLRDDMVVAGRAMTVLESDITEGDEGGAPFGVMFEALDDLKRNEVYVCTGGGESYAQWGELMSTRAMKAGGVGAVVNGSSRDTNGILRLNFPTFSTGRYAQDQRPRGRVVDWRIPVDIGGVVVRPGDVVFGDIDGVLTIPKEIEREIIAAAFEKVTMENKVRTAIEAGMPSAEAFRTFGVM